MDMKRRRAVGRRGEGIAGGCRAAFRPLTGNQNPSISDFLKIETIGHVAAATMNRPQTRTPCRMTMR